jgi:hypothetical protein
MLQYALETAGSSELTGRVSAAAITVVLEWVREPQWFQQREQRLAAATPLLGKLTPEFAATAAEASPYELAALVQACVDFRFCNPDLWSSSLAAFVSKFKQQQQQQQVLLQQQHQQLPPAQMAKYAHSVLLVVAPMPTKGFKGVKDIWSASRRDNIPIRPFYTASS